MTASIHLGTGETCGTRIVLDPLAPNGARGPCVLLTLEGRIPGNIMNCAIIPVDRIAAVVASLQLVAAEAGRA
jgi:hypothetical protein